MLVYLDSSNIFDILKDHLDLSALMERDEVSLVFSWAHFDDAGGGGSRGYAELADFIQRWPNVTFATHPRLIPALEFRNFVTAHPGLPSKTPSVVASDNSELEAIVADASGIERFPDHVISGLEVQLDKLRELRRLSAKASTLSKHAAAMKPPSASPPTPAEAAQMFISSMLSQDDETLSLLRLSVESDTLPRFPDELPGSGVEQQLLWREIQEIQRRMVRGALAQDVQVVIEVMAEQASILPRLEADPLLGPTIVARRNESERWSCFNLLCVLPAKVGGLSDSSTKQIYDAMVAHPELCPAWTLRWKIEARMKRDAQTPTKSSDDIDLDHLMLLPYVDVIFVDTRIHAYVTQCKDIARTDREKCVRTKDAARWLNSLGGR